MRRKARIVVAAQAALVAAFAVALRSGRMPLGVPGQWEWQRIKVAPSSLSILMGLAAVAAYSAFAVAGHRALLAKERKPTLRVWLAGLVLASIGVQGLVQDAAPEPYGLSKWIIALHSSGSSGYYTIAKAQMNDPRRVLAD
jgi:hypothetical protein